MAWRINHPDDEQLVTIAVFDNHAEFLLARSRLESASIECFSRNEHTARIAGHFTGVFGMHQIELQVRQTDAEDAAGMLQSESPADEGDVLDEQ
jgi:Putative prokaryotic signal transducing protein